MTALQRGPTATVRSVAHLLRVVRPLARRPWLWPTALRQLVVMAPPRWWTSSPFLPVPSVAYLRFRLVTAYGGDGTLPVTDRRAAETMGADLVAYLEWCRSRPLGRRRRPGPTGDDRSPSVSGRIARPRRGARRG